MSWLKNVTQQYAPVGGAIVGGTAGFMMGGPAGAALGTGMGYQMGSQYQQSNLKYQLQQDQLAYQMATQQQVFQREDNSIARRVADLKSMGMSPVLAAGQGAGSGAIVKTEAPQKYVPDYMSSIAGMANIFKMKSDITRTEAETTLIKMNALKAMSEMEYIQEQTINQPVVRRHVGAQTTQAFQQAEAIRLDNIRRMREAQLTLLTGVTGDDWFSRLFRNTAGVSDNATSNVRWQNSTQSSRPATNRFGNRSIFPLW